MKPLLHQAVGNAFPAVKKHIDNLMLMLLRKVQSQLEKKYLQEGQDLWDTMIALQSNCTDKESKLVEFKQILKD